MDSRLSSRQQKYEAIERIFFDNRNIVEITCSDKSLRTGIFVASDPRDRLALAGKQQFRLVRKFDMPTAQDDVSEQNSEILDVDEIASIRFAPSN